jgi:hypothetical protein
MPRPSSRMISLKRYLDQIPHPSQKPADTAQDLEGLRPETCRSSFRLHLKNISRYAFALGRENDVQFLTMAGDRP